MAHVKDPVCGMTIETTEAAATYDYNGETYYFCAEACRDAFASDPGRYVEREVPIEAAPLGDETPVERHEPPFTTKGIPTGKFGSAGSGGAEFDPGPERHDPDRH